MLTSWEPVSFSRRTLLHGASKYFAWVFQVVSFPQLSPPKPCVHLSSHPTCYDKTFCFCLVPTCSGTSAIGVSEHAVHFRGYHRPNANRVLPPHSWCAGRHVRSPPLPVPYQHPLSEILLIWCLKCAINVFRNKLFFVSVDQNKQVPHSNLKANFLYVIPQKERVLRRRSKLEVWIHRRNVWQWNATLRPRLCAL